MKKNLKQCVILFFFIMYHCVFHGALKLEDPIKMTAGVVLSLAFLTFGFHFFDKWFKERK